MTVYPKVLTAVKAVRSLARENFQVLPSIFKPTGEIRDADSQWHPHLGDVGGLALADWLKAVPASPTVRRSIVLATEERSGSEWLCQLAGSTGKLGRPSEYLNTCWFQQFIPDYPENVSEQIGLAHRAGTTPNGVFCMKLHIWHFERLAASARLTDVFPKPVFVRLTRQDRLGQAISLVRARQTQAYHAHRNKAQAECYDRDSIQRTLKELVDLAGRWSLYFARNGIEPLSIDYSELMTDPSSVVQRIGAVAGVDISRADVRPDRPLKIQRDDVTADWRSRFVAEMGDLNQVD